MPGLVPGIHVFLFNDREDVDGRDQPGHDEKIACNWSFPLPFCMICIIS
jgi:hypothetical protein